MEGLPVKGSMKKKKGVPLLQKLNEEFSDCIIDLMYNAKRLCCPFDRVRVMQWVRKLSQLDDRKLEIARMRNEYVHYLRIMLSGSPLVLSMPFRDDPPEEEEFAPLTEVLANKMREKCPHLPRAGPIRPVLQHQTVDGRAFMTVKRCPDGGVFCYMAVSPKSMLPGEEEEGNEISPGDFQKPSKR